MALLLIQLFCGFPWRTWCFLISLQLILIKGSSGTKLISSPTLDPLQKIWPKKYILVVKCTARTHALWSFKKRIKLIIIWNISNLYANFASNLVKVCRILDFYSLLPSSIIFQLSYWFSFFLSLLECRAIIYRQVLYAFSTNKNFTPIFTTYHDQWNRRINAYLPNK